MTEIDAIQAVKEPAKRCSEWIEVEWPGHRAVLSRNRCGNKTRHVSGKCHHHRPWQPPKSDE